MEPPRGGLFGMDGLMNLCRSSRIVVVSSSHRGIFSKWALVGRGHGDSDRSLFSCLSIRLFVSPGFNLTKDFMPGLVHMSDIREGI